MPDQDVGGLSLVNVTSHHRKRLQQNLKEAVNNMYLWPTILYSSETWCLRESEIGISTTDRSVVRAMIGEQQ